MPSAPGYTNCILQTRAVMRSEFPLAGGCLVPKVQWGELTGNFSCVRTCQQALVRCLRLCLLEMCGHVLQCYCPIVPCILQNLKNSSVIISEWQEYSEIKHFFNIESLCGPAEKHQLQNMVNPFSTKMIFPSRKRCALTFSCKVLQKSRILRFSSPGQHHWLHERDCSEASANEKEETSELYHQKDAALQKLNKLLIQPEQNFL